MRGRICFPFLCGGIRSFDRASENRTGSVTPLVAVHGLVFFAWLLLFIARRFWQGREIWLCIAE